MLADGSRVDPQRVLKGGHPPRDGPGLRHQDGQAVPVTLRGRSLAALWRVRHRGQEGQPRHLRVLIQRHGGQQGQGQAVDAVGHPGKLGLDGGQVLPLGPGHRAPSWDWS